VVSSVTKTTAISGGNITNSGSSPVTVRGVCWSTQINPTIADNTSNEGSSNGLPYISSITGLSSGVTYHIRAYATSDFATGYGDDISFTTLGTAATVITGAASSITATSAIAGGNVTSEGSSPVVYRGVCWSTTAYPTTADNITTDGAGTGVFASSITGLSSNVTYHFRAYVTTLFGTYYGADNIISTTTGLFDEKLLSITLYPNPVIDILKINGLEEKGTFTLSDLSGRILINKNVTPEEFISFKTVSRGIYIVKITTTNGTIEKKVIKK